MLDLLFFELWRDLHKSQFTNRRQQSLLSFLNIHFVQISLPYCAYSVNCHVRFQLYPCVLPKGSIEKFHPPLLRLTKPHAIQFDHINPTISTFRLSIDTSSRSAINSTRFVSPPSHYAIDHIYPMFPEAFIDYGAAKSVIARAKPNVLHEIFSVQRNLTK